jgi:hypothetical protein
VSRRKAWLASSGYFFAIAGIGRRIVLGSITTRIPRWPTA